MRKHTLILSILFVLVVIGVLLVADYISFKAEEREKKEISVAILNMAPSEKILEPLKLTIADVLFSTAEEEAQALVQEDVPESLPKFVNLHRNQTTRKWEVISIEVYDFKPLDPP